MPSCSKGLGDEPDKPLKELILNVLKTKIDTKKPHSQWIVTTYKCKVSRHLGSFRRNPM